MRECKKEEEEKKNQKFIEGQERQRKRLIRRNTRTEVTLGNDGENEVIIIDRETQPSRRRSRL